MSAARIGSSANFFHRLVLDADTGKVMATPSVAAGTDAGLFDPETANALATAGGSATLTIVHEDSPDRFRARRQCSHPIGRPDDGFGHQDSQYPSGHCEARHGQRIPGVAQHVRRASDCQVTSEMTVYMGYCGAEYQTRSNRLAHGFSRPEQCWWRCRFSELVRHAARKSPA